MGMPFPKSLGSWVIFCEYLRLTRSAVLSWPGRCGLSLGRGASGGRCPDRLDSLDGRPLFWALESVAAPRPTGIGALIWRGALMTGGPPFLFLSLRFLLLRSEIPFPFSSDMVPAGQKQELGRRGCDCGARAVVLDSLHVLYVEEVSSIHGWPELTLP